MGVREQDRILSTITAGGLPVYQDAQELKRKRNRLAQRKHRDRELRKTLLTPTRTLTSFGGLVATSSTDNGPPDAEETSAAGGTYSPPGKGVTQKPWETSMNQVHFPTDDTGNMISAMDFSLPGFAGNMDDASHMPDLERQMIPMPREGFDNFETVYPPATLGMQHKMVEEAYRMFLSQNDSSMVSGIAPRQSPSRPLQMNPPSTKAEAQDSQPLPRRHNPSPQHMSTSDDAKKPPGSTIAPHSGQTSSGGNQDPAGSNSDTSPLSTTDAEMTSEHFSRLQTPGVDPDAGDLEARFERIIRIIEEAGFESIDDMSMQYYTATFREDTPPYWAQSRSRSRSLPSFLAALHASAEKWPSREVQGYRQQIAEAAESLYVREFAHVIRNVVQNGDHLTQPVTPVSPMSPNMKSLWQTIADLELSPDFRHKKVVIREMVSLVTALCCTHHLPSSSPIPFLIAKNLTRDDHRCQRLGHCSPNWLERRTYVSLEHHKPSLHFSFSFLNLIRTHRVRCRGLLTEEQHPHEQEDYKLSFRS